MESLKCWQLCDELTVNQAALLIVGADPGGEAAYAETWPVHQRPAGYEAAKSALTHAINAGRLRASIRYSAREYGWADHLADIEASEAEFMKIKGSTLEDGERLSEGETFVYHPDPDWNRTTVQVDHLRAWLAQRGVKAEFFFPAETDMPGYLDRNHPRYAPKLAAAVRAWQAVNDPKGKHPRQALVIWLRDHAGEFPPTKGGAGLSGKAIDECAAVANWRPDGGAPKTPERYPGTK